MVWVASILLTAASLGIFSIGVTLVLGRRVLKELTRPGITIEPGTEEFGDIVLPDIFEMPLEHMRRSFHFLSADKKTRLYGEFWTQAQEAATVILCHGFRFPSKNLRSVAALAYQCGVNVLLFDFRGHDRSEHVAVTCGNAEVQDLMAAISIAQEQPETAHKKIFLLGFSMGAAVSILLPPHPSVAGIIADSPYSRLDDVIRTLVHQTLRQETAKWPGPAKILIRCLIPILAHLAIVGGQVLFYLQTRSSLVARPDRAIGKQGWKAPLVLIHAIGDPFTAHHHAHRLAAAARAAGRVVQEYYTPSSIHCGSYGHDPHQYMKLIQEVIFL